MKKILRDADGSLTLEATIVFPFFLAILLLLINLVNILLTYLAMDHAVRETVKQIAVQAYPLSYLKTDFGVSSTQNKFDSYVNIIGQKIKGEASDAAVNALTKAAVSEKIKELYPLNFTALRELKITVLNMYNPNRLPAGSAMLGQAWDNRDIAVSVEYKIKPMVPFLPLQEVVLSNSAAERAWVDD